MLRSVSAMLLGSCLSMATVAQNARILLPADTDKTLGALSNDLVYTPVARCRIVETANTAAGAIPGGATRNFVAVGIFNFASQGGSSTNCGVDPLAATAVVLNVTAVAPSSAGSATLYPFGTTPPASGSIHYAAGAVISNELVVQTPNPIAQFDFTVATTATSHFRIDIVGYFAPPVATDLQCLDTADTVQSILSGTTGTAVAPVCPTGYFQTATNCKTNSWLMPLVSFSNGICSARNNDNAARELRANRTCCRVPGPFDTADSRPTFTTAAAISRQQGTPAGAAVAVGTAADATTPAASLVVTQIPGGTATDITVGTITNTNGAIAAPVSASCNATAGTVRFQVSDGSLTGTGDLQVIVSANSAPTLTFPTVNLGAGAGTTITPATGPSDNGSVPTILLQSQGTYSGTISVDNGTGVVTLSNAAPIGTHAITIRASDNCNSNTDATFDVTVQGSALFSDGFEGP